VGRAPQFRRQNYTALRAVARDDQVNALLAGGARFIHVYTVDLAGQPASAVVLVCCSSIDGL
jgi:hypothetical protein